MKAKHGIKKEILRLRLDVPDKFWDFTEEALAEMGCGPGEFGDKLVPDTMYGLYIGLACKVHDVDFAIGTPETIANRRFWRNLDIIITKKSKNALMRYLRRLRATTYYHMVMEHGSKYRNTSVADAG